MGANNKDGQATFLWEATRRLVTQTLWAIGQPYDFYGNKNCTFSSFNGKLMNYDCDMSMYAVNYCEKMLHPTACP